MPEASSFAASVKPACHHRLTQPECAEEAYADALVHAGSFFDYTYEGLQSRCGSVATLPHVVVLP